VSFRLVEGGARVLTSFLKAKLVDRIIVSLAPMILASARTRWRLDVDCIGDGLRLTNRSVYRAGDDLLFAGDLPNETAELQTA